jgi:hypothetical protein
MALKASDSSNYSYGSDPADKSVIALCAAISNVVPAQVYCRVWAACRLALGARESPNSAIRIHRAQVSCPIVYQQLPTIVPWSMLTKDLLDYFTGDQPLPASPKRSAYECSIIEQTSPFKTPPKQSAQTALPPPEPVAPNAPAHDFSTKPKFAAPASVCKQLFR